MYGFNGVLLDWFKDYLTDRLQRVTVDGHKSSYLDVLSGVPQGSILGPLLFNLYINDMCRNLTDQWMLYMYADDSKIYKTINNINDCHEL